jgi:hypothetical protein
MNIYTKGFISLIIPLFFLSFNIEKTNTNDQESYWYFYAISSVYTESKKCYVSGAQYFNGKTGYPYVASYDFHPWAKRKWLQRVKEKFPNEKFSDQMDVLLIDKKEHSTTVPLDNYEGVWRRIRFFAKEHGDGSNNPVREVDCYNCDVGDYFNRH